MEVRSVLVCLFVCVCAGGVVGQVGSICRPNERLLPCGCHKTCRDPAPDCQGVCQMGCFCSEGEVRNEDGLCVKLAECPPTAYPYRLQTTEPRFHECPYDQEYRYCETCNRTCDNPNPVCPAQCARGCFCKGNLLKDKDGRCVTFDRCPNFEDYIREREKNVIKEPIPYRFSCGKNQEYIECNKCTQSCSDPEPVCGQCKTGCFCKPGFLKGPSGKCVKREECPAAAVTSQVEAQESPIEECSSSEEYYSCGWCEATCQQPAPHCPDGCTAGCQCRPPLLRHASGACVDKEMCLHKNCSDPNEEYTCQFGCEPKCKHNLCRNKSSLNRLCVLRCHCKKDLFRDAQGKCVPREQCLEVTTY